MKRLGDDLRERSDGRLNEDKGRKGKKAKVASKRVERASQEK
jgi:hypothetical protein